jgi:RNA polymerase sigma-70 factor (ECF subfamily)
MIFKLNKNSLQSDEELLSLYVATSNQEVLGKLYSRYIPLVYGLCLKYLHHQQDAEDAVMQIYEGLIDKCLNHEISNFKSWLYSVTKNHCLQIIRKTTPKYFEEISNQVVETEPFLHLIDDSNDKEKELALNRCLAGLPKDQLKCITSFFFDSCSYADIVLMTGYTLNKVKSYIQNGKRNLKTCMVKALQL